MVIEDKSKYILIIIWNRMGEKRVDRFTFKLTDLLGEGSYGKVLI